MKFAFSRNLWLILTFIIAFTFLFASYIPNIYEASVVDLMPKDRVMLWGEHIYTYDYNVYLSKIRQATEGRWSVVDKYDNNPNQKGVFLQMLYLLTGKVGAILRLTPDLSFHLLRTLLSFLWVLTIIYLNIFFLKTPKRYTVGILLSLLAASWPVFYTYQESTWIGMYMSWWQEMDVLKRISYIPHYTLNYIITSILSILLYKSQIPTHKKQMVRQAHHPEQSRGTNLNSQNPKSKTFLPFDNLKFNYCLEIGNWKLEIDANFLKICVLLFFSFFIHPSAGILFLFSWTIYHLIVTYMTRPSNIGYFIKLFIYTAILFAVASIPLLYFRNITTAYPWKSLVDFDKNNRYPVNVKDYVLALGPIFFTGSLGLIVALIKKEQKYLSLISWILGAFVAIYVFKKFPYQSELRFVQTANHIPLAILSVYFFSNIINGRDVQSGRLYNRIIKFAAVIIVVAVILLGLVQSYFSIRAQTDFIHQRAVAVQPLVPYPSQVMYPLKDFWQALIWLEKNTSRNSVVISQVTAGNYIPAYSGNFVYLGHNPETPFFDQRSNNVNQFFSGTMSEQDALNFLKKENISYVFYGPQEKEKSVEDIKKYSFLKEVLTFPYVMIYKVEN